MARNSKPSRRSILKAGLAGAAATASIPSIRTARAQDSRPVVFAFMGQHCHNPIFMEQNLRATLAKMNWRVRFTQYAEFVTPGEIENFSDFQAVGFQLLDSIAGPGDNCSIVSDLFDMKIIGEQFFYL